MLECKKGDAKCIQLEKTNQSIRELIGEGEGLAGTIPPTGGRTVDLTRFGYPIRGIVMTPTRFALAKLEGGGSSVTIEGNIEIHDVPWIRSAIIKNATVSLPSGDVRGQAYGYWGSFSGSGNYITGAWGGTYRFGPISTNVPWTFGSIEGPNLTSLCQQNRMVCK